MLEAAEGLYDGDKFAWGEALPHRVLGNLPQENGLDGNDAGEDCLLAKHVPAGLQSALAENQLAVRRDPNGLEQADFLDGPSQGLDIAHVFAIGIADLDVVDVDFDGVHEGVSGEKG